MIRFYLDEEPRLRSVPSIDPAETELAGLDELVLKPRDGFGGRGVTILARAGAAERRWAIAQLRRRPEAFVLQRAVALSFHPTVCGARLQPRRVDLRPFAVVGSNGVAVPPLGLTRFAVGADDMVVNSSRGGGCKDTWVLNR
jgi:uncharacterized circularly permuted ATP-grasp superfamily protein